MSRATTQGSAAFRPMTFVAFLVGAGLGFVLVAPVLPGTLSSEFQALLTGGGAVVLAGVAAFAAVLAVLALLYQGYLKA